MRSVALFYDLKTRYDFEGEEEQPVNDREYGELMRCLLFFRELYSSEEEFKKFVVESLQTFLYDLRDFQVYISISPASLREAPESRAADG